MTKTKEHEVWETKLAVLRRYMAAGDSRGALKLAASWGKRGLGGGPEADAILAGWEALVRPKWRLDLGKDPVAEITAGIAAIKTKYGI